MWNHHLSETVAKKPGMILFYNETNSGVDTVDQMIDTYRFKAGTRRWPMIVFYTHLDVTSTITRTIHQEEMLKDAA